MAGRNMGFDPLSSLFEAPEPGLASPVARAESPAPAPAPAPALSAAAPAPADPSSVPAPKAAPAIDKAAIAKAVARAATQRLAAQKSPVAAPAPEPVAKKKVSRLDSLAARAIRPLPGDALAAARAAAEVEAADAKVAAEAAVQAHAADRELRTEEARDRVQALIPTLLPGLGSVFVSNAILVDERTLLVTLWKSHRTRFVQDGQLERAVSASVVLHALDKIVRGNLVAAHMTTDASDYLVWIDMGENSLLAAFADARAYFAGSN